MRLQLLVVELNCKSHEPDSTVVEFNRKPYTTIVTLADVHDRLRVYCRTRQHPQQNNKVTVTQYIIICTTIHLLLSTPVVAMVQGGPNPTINSKKRDGYTLSTTVSGLLLVPAKTGEEGKGKKNTHTTKTRK